MKRLISLAPVFFLLTSATGLTQESSPYAGQDKRSIKALSGDEIVGYLEGHGMGMAKAAELNHYPGPKHVLELADELRLTDAQRERTMMRFSTMKTRATSLGTLLVEKERELDEAFAAGRITVEELRQLVEDIALLRGKIRFAHLEAHLAQREVLTPDQIQLYDELRGY